jgi:hypothetical protein
MRKWHILTVIFAIAMAFAACKKEYTCECTSTDDNGNEVGSTTTKKEFSSESDAEEWCNGHESETTSGGTTVTTECELSS